MATATRGKAPSWKQPGSPIGRRGARKANPKYSGIRASLGNAAMFRHSSN